MLERKDIITDDALQAPAILAAEFEKLLQKVNSISDGIKTAMGSFSKSTSIKEMSDSVQHLTESEKEVIKVQNQISSALTKQNDEYIEYKRILNEVNKATSEKIKYGGIDAKTVDAQSSSIEDLGKALTKNRQEYARLRSEEARSSKEGKALLATIQKQDEQYKQLKNSIGQNQDNVGDYTGALRQMKAEMKAAQGEMASIAETLGQDSMQYQEAAKRAGELADKMADAKDEAKAFQGDTAVENMSTRFGLLGQKLKNLDFKGAGQQMQGILKLSQQMTFKETFSGIGQLTKGFGSLSKAILTNPLFIIAAVIIGVGVAIYKLRDSLLPLKAAFDFVGGGIDWIVNKLKNFSDQLGLSTFAVDEKAEAFKKAQEKEMAALEKRYDYEIRLAQAAGKEVDALEISKYQSFIDYNNKRIDELKAQQEASEAAANKEKESVAEIKSAYQGFNVYSTQASKALSKSRENDARALSEIEKQQLEELIIANQDFQKEIEIIQARIKKGNDDAAVERLKQADEEAKKLLELQIKIWEDVQKKRDTLNKRTEKHSVEQQLRDRIALQLQDIFLKKGEKINLNEAERAEISKRIHEYVESTKGDIDALADSTATLQQAWTATAPGVQAIFDNLTARRLQNIDLEIQALDRQTQRELEAAGNNAAAKAQIQATAEKRRQELEKKRLAEQQRQAKFDKAVALTGSIINTARGVTSALAMFPPNIPLSILVGISGALQTAAIAAQPIPKYEKGTMGVPHKGGWALVGEKGSELMSTPSGLFLSPDKPTLLNLPKGSEVIPNDETMRILAMRSMHDQIKVDNDNILLQHFLSHVQDAYKKGARDIVNAIYANNKGDLVQEYSILNRVKKLQDGNKKIVRQKAMGL